MLELLNACMPKFHLQMSHLPCSLRHLHHQDSLWILKFPIHSNVEDQFHCVTQTTELYLIWNYCPLYRWGTHLWCSSLAWFLVFTFVLELKMHKYPIKWIVYSGSGLFLFELLNAVTAFTVCDVFLSLDLNTIRST